MVNNNGSWKRIFKLYLITENNQIIDVTATLEMKTPSIEEENGLPPGFNSIYYGVEVNFEPAINNKEVKNLTRISFALPGKTRDGQLAKLTVGHIAQGIISTLKENNKIEIKEIGIQEEGRLL